MDCINLPGVILTPLARFSNPLGDVWHAMKSSELSFQSFGEAYFTHIHPGKTKGWRKHSKMLLNLIVPRGEVLFGMLDDRKDSATLGKSLKISIGENQYSRLTIPPGIWVGFQGLGEHTSLILNLASIEHDPEEALSKPLDSFPFDWSIS